MEGLVTQSEQEVSTVRQELVALEKDASLQKLQVCWRTFGQWVAARVPTSALGQPG